MLKTASIILFFAAISSWSLAQIIPEERRIDWNPGIPDGIPEMNNDVRNIIDYGADPTGVQDSRSALISAMNAVPAAGGVVYIPEGTFRIASKISIGRNNVVFRGTGRKSKLHIESDGDCIEIITYQRGTWQTLTDGATKGSMNITVPDGSKFTAGQFAEIEQDNDSILMYTKPEWIVSWAENSVGQLFEVESVVGNELTFKAPVNYSFSAGLNARIRPQGLVHHVGFENLYIEKMLANGNTFLFKNTAYCWIRNVESYHTRRTHVHQTTTLGNEIRDSYFHRSFSYGGGGSGYGVECASHVTNTLVENNIFDSLRHAMIIQVGANGNVYGYNYSINPVQGDGETNLNAGWIPPDISVHGHYPFMNLFEGNELDEIGIGDYWGPAGPGNTYFRNKVNDEGILYYDASHDQNVIGNISTELKDDSNKSFRKLEHGNVINSSVLWDPDIPDHELPDSYYLDSVPAFFEDSLWPVFGPDIPTQNKLPAQLRLENMPYLNVTESNNTVGQYEKLEFTIDNGKAYLNPFDPEEADISGRFISPTNDTMHINAFWDGSAWKLRFAGAETGSWNYTMMVNDGNGSEIKSGSFTVTESARKGWIRPSAADPHYFALDDGSPFYGVGMAVPWLIYDQRYYEQPGLLSRLKTYGVNFINWLFTSWDITLLRDSYASYSMEDAENFDALIADAEQQDIKLLLGIWIHDLLRDVPHPWSGFYDWKSNPFNQLSSVDDFFSDSLSWVYQENYYRYIIARWGYSSSIALWHTVAEINGTNAIYDDYAMKNDERGWHYKINRYFMENDPFRHPTTVSGSGGYDFSDGWDITQAPQVHEYPWPADRIKENPDRIAFWSDRLFTSYEKPNLVGEFGKYLYEEGISESFLHNGIWAGLMSGVAATPLHWWGGQIASQPENFSTFNETMLSQLLFLKNFVDDMDMAAYNFTSLYSAPADEKITISNIPGGKVYGLAGDSVSICWVYFVDETSTGIYSEVGLTIPGLTEEAYTVSFYNTWDGSWYSEEMVTETVNGELTFICPDFTGDIAIKIAHTEVIDETGIANSDPLRFKIYPNPCSSVLNIENIIQVESIQLLDLFGQVLEKKFVDNSDQVIFNLSPYSYGVYILEFRNKTGSINTRKIVYSN